ncbi:MAG: hypothetical protein JST86_10060 [Bacteroidetes bacterium]|nr:hypothetical protein [Bacteroidota bacterium]
MNIAAYIIYLLLTGIITIKVGQVLFHHGRFYILSAMHGDETLTGVINKLLLTGYYLVNLGYAALMLRNWQTITTVTQLVSSVGTMTGRIVFSLAIMHYLNILWIALFGKQQQLFSHHKK